MPQSPLRAFLKPESVAIIGASRDRAKRGNRAIQALLDAGFCGPMNLIGLTKLIRELSPRLIRDWSCEISLSRTNLPECCIG